MSKETLATETSGEGFAFFRWHMLKWPGEVCTCRQHLDYWCFKCWIREDWR